MNLEQLLVFWSQFISRCLHCYRFVVKEAVWSWFVKLITRAEVVSPHGVRSEPSYWKPFLLVNHRIFQEYWPLTTASKWITCSAINLITDTKTVDGSYFKHVYCPSPWVSAGGPWDTSQMHSRKTVVTQSLMCHENFFYKHCVCV